MIDRYKVEDIEKIWSDENKYDVWKDVELYVTEAWSKIGVVPKEDLEKIKKNIKVDLKRMLEIEEETKHDVVAFTRMLSEQLGNEKKWIHLGITSTDIVDTAQNILINESYKIVKKDLNELSKTIYSIALENKETLIMGRTHGIYGEPTSLGLKFLLWFEEINRQVKRVDQAIKDVAVTKISGSMGNYANLELEIEEYTSQLTGLPVDLLSNQVSQRDRLASLFSSVANLASTYEKIVTEIRLFQRSEVKELLEGFSANQKGSSSMPHKKNPISSENITGLVRLIKSYVNIAYENNVLWHERDISHSSNERVIIPDMFHLITYTTRRLTKVLKDLVINKEKMIQHIGEAKHVYFSQPILTYVLKHKDVSREEIYDFIQKVSIEAIQNNEDFKDSLLRNNVEKYISLKELDDIFDDKYFLRNVDKIFNRLKK